MKAYSQRDWYDRLGDVVLSIMVLGFVVFVAVICAKVCCPDTSTNYRQAILTLPNGEIVSGEVESYIYNTSNQTCIVTIDGITYRVPNNSLVIMEGNNNGTDY